MQIKIEGITSTSDPQLVSRCAEFFLRNGQQSKAIELFASSGNHEEALKMIEKYNIKLNQELVDRLSNIQDGDSDRKNEVIIGFIQ